MSVRFTATAADTESLKEKILLAMYIELDHNLVAGNVENINEKVVLGGRKEDEEREAARSEDWRTDEYLLNKYNISKQPVKDILLKKESESPKVI